MITMGIFGFFIILFIIILIIKYNSPEARKIRKECRMEEQEEREKKRKEQKLKKKLIKEKQGNCQHDFMDLGKVKKTGSYCLDLFGGGPSENYTYYVHVFYCPKCELKKEIKL